MMEFRVGTKDATNVYVHSTELDLADDRGERLFIGFHPTVAQWLVEKLNEHSSEEEQDFLARLMVIVRAFKAHPLTTLPARPDSPPDGSQGLA